MSLFPVCLTLLTFFNPDAYIRGKELLDQGQPKQALPVLEEAVINHPNWYYPLMLRGACYLKLNKFNEAEADLKDAASMEMKPEEKTTVHFYLGRTYMAKRQWTQAADLFEGTAQTAAVNRKFQLFFNAGQCAFQMAKKSKGSDKVEHYQRMVTNLDQALKNDSKHRMSKDAAWQRGYAQLQLFLTDRSPVHLDRGIANMQAWLKQDPKDQKAHQMLISLHHQKADNTSGGKAHYGSMAKACQEYLNNWPKDTAILKKQAAAYRGAGQLSNAITSLEKLVKVAPTDGDAHFMLGANRYKLNRYSSALEAFKGAIANGEGGKAQPYSLAAHCMMKGKKGCYATDKTIYQDAINLLKQGNKKASGKGMDKLEAQLARMEQNYQVLKENHLTDEENHRTVLASIPKIRGVLTANKAKLRRVNEKIVDFPTLFDELSAEKKEVEAVIAADEETLQAELDTLKSYVKAAKKCGGSNFSNFSAMKKMLETKGI